jgi:transposase
METDMSTSTTKTKNSKSNKPSATAGRPTKKAVEQVKSAAVNAKQTAIESAENIAEAAVEQTRNSAEQVAASGKNQTEDIIRSISRAIDAGRASLENDGMNKTASYARLAADGLGKAANEVDKIDTRNLASRAENIVRENPMLTFGALALAGVAVATALKNNSQS